jgi:hypothetical protein
MLTMMALRPLYSLRVFWMCCLPNLFGSSGLYSCRLCWLLMLAGYVVYYVVAPSIFSPDILDLLPAWLNWLFLLVSILVGYAGFF